MEDIRNLNCFIDDEGIKNLERIIEKKIAKVINESNPEDEHRLEMNRKRVASYRLKISNDKRNKIRHFDAVDQAKRRQNEKQNTSEFLNNSEETSHHNKICEDLSTNTSRTDAENCQKRQKLNAKRRAKRANESPLERKHRLEMKRLQVARCKANKSNDQNIKVVQERKSKTINIGLTSDINENEIKEFSCGKMNVECQYCNALHFVAERAHDNNFSNCCHKGKVELVALKQFPEDLKNLMIGTHQYSKTFLKNIRQYNSSFAFSSTGYSGIIQKQPANRGTFVFRISGQPYHLTSVLETNDENSPKYAQLYVLDEEDANKFRISDSRNEEFNPNLLQIISNVMSYNPLAKMYRCIKECEDENILLAAEGDEPYKMVEMRLTVDPYLDPRRFNAQAINEVAMVFKSADGIPPNNRDIRIYPRDRQKPLIHVNECHSLCDPMSYPLLFPMADKGWSFNDKKLFLYNKERTQKSEKRISTLQFYAYRLALRKEFNPIWNAGKLTLQFIVDTYCKVESQRLLYIRLNQDKLRVSNYKGLMDHLHGSAGDLGIPAGKPVILPSNFLGSPRNMNQNYQDSMAIVSKFGKPDLFITFTCNPRWKEISENLQFGQKAEFRPDLIVRVFNIKLKELLRDLTVKMVLGECVAFVYVIEFQKRGLPHAHILLIIGEEDKILNADKIDEIVCAEIPDEQTQPRLYETVTTCMMHGPCGKHDNFEMLNMPCIDHSNISDTQKYLKCKKKFPKDYQDSTLLVEDGYPSYRRRNNSRHIYKNGVRLDNRWVVPYNQYLALKYNAHINVEVCTSIQCVKYLYKYVYKGYDCANVTFDNYDEIEKHLQGRYVSAVEAMWRLLEFPMHGHSHAVIRLPVHLLHCQPIEFQDGAEMEAIRRAEKDNRNSMLTAYFKLNATDSFAATLYYSDIPQQYVWNSKTKSWKPRQRFEKIVARMYSVNTADGERYYLRMLLCHVKGATSFENLRTVNGIEHTDFKTACESLHLLDDDSEWKQCLLEAKSYQMPKQLRLLFSHILLYCSPINATAIWDEFKDDLAQDFLRNVVHEDFNTKILIAYNKALAEIVSTLSNNLGGSQLENIILTLPKVNLDYANYEYTDSNAPPLFDHAAYVIANEALLNTEQKLAYDTIIGEIDNFTDNKRFFFLDGPGGSGKTFMYNLILSYCNVKNYNTIAVASTGIAATLIAGGQTAHSRFGIPVPVNETSLCNVTEDNKVVLYNTKLILWDEASMVTCNQLSAVDRLLRDITRKQIPFGGKVLLLGGDFRQNLPVILHANQTKIIEQCLISHPLWPRFTKLKLTQNMRVNSEEIQFSNWLIKLGNGTLTNDVNLPGNTIEIDQECIEHGSIVKSIFGDKINSSQFEELTKMALLSPLNKDVLNLNDEIIQLLEGESRTYYSVDKAICLNKQDKLTIPVQYLNELTPSGMAPHVLKLKVGAIIMLLRNIDSKAGLCNGTRLRIAKLQEHLIEAKILVGTFKDQTVLIPRIIISPSDTEFPFILSRKQFPVRVSFAMTINKSQGQSFDKVGIYLPKHVFGHGQLYTAFSRAKVKAGVKVHIKDTRTQGKLIRKSDRVFTPNIVYHNVL